MDFEYLDSGRRGSERDEMAIVSTILGATSMANVTSFLSFSKLKETEELAAGRKPDQWGSDFTAELSSREEGKRPSSPSPSDGQSSSPHSGIAILVYMYITFTLTWNDWDISVVTYFHSTRIV